MCAKGTRGTQPGVTSHSALDCCGNLWRNRQRTLGLRRLRRREDLVRRQWHGNRRVERNGRDRWLRAKGTRGRCCHDRGRGRDRGHRQDPGRRRTRRWGRGRPRTGDHFDRAGRRGRRRQSTRGGRWRDTRCQGRWGHQCWVAPGLFAPLGVVGTVGAGADLAARPPRVDSEAVAVDAHLALLPCADIHRRSTRARVLGTRGG